MKNCYISKFLRESGKNLHQFEQDVLGQPPAKVQPQQETPLNIST